MAGLSSYLAQALYDLTLVSGTVSVVAPAGDVYMSLHTADPADGATNTEATYSTYARVKVGTTAYDAGAGVAANTQPIVFPNTPSVGGTFTVTHWGIWNAQTVGEGSLLYSGALAVPRVVPANTSVEFPIGQLQITFV